MHLLSVNNVAAEVDGRTLFSGVSFGLTSHDRVAVVGPNGVGKTTLLSIVAGTRLPESGEVVTRTGLRIAFLAQQTGMEDVAARQAVLDADATARPHEADLILQRLGIDPDRPTDELSGGQRRRVELARTLLSPSDLLILDEPTNHLDVDTIDWLEAELGRRAGGLLLVTHDRYLLERITNRMLDLEPVAPGRPAQAWWHEGSYSTLLEARAERAAQRQQATLRARSVLRKEVAWLQRQPRARTSKPKFRIEQTQALAAMAADDPQARPLELGTGRRRLGNQVIELSGVTVKRGDRVVLDAVDLEIGPGERVGIVGPNGAGKTTLLATMAGTLPVDAGTVSIGQTVQLGMYEQQAGSGLDVEQTVLESVEEIATHIPLENGEQLTAGRLAERFGFDDRTQRTPIKLLSGGERRRVALLHLLVDAPNVMLLDEPTNDLDLDTLATLEDHLDGFTGTLIVASHDRFVLDRLTDRTIAIEDGRLTEHLDLEAYRQTREQRRSEATAREDASGPGRGSQPAGSQTRSNQERERMRKRVRSLERQVEQLTHQRDELHQAMADAAREPERLGALQAELSEVETTLSEAEDAWLELSVDLEA